MARWLFLAALTACAHRVPTATPADPELCLHDGREPPRLVAPHGDLVSVCYGDGDCLVLDHVRGRVVARAAWPAGAEQGLPDELKVPEPPGRFELERTERETAVCDKTGGCRRLRLPGVADQRTVMPAISADGGELYFVAHDGDRAFLDTIAVDARARRTNRVALPGADAAEHGFDVDRVGTAVLVRESIHLGLHDTRSSRVLVDPYTSAIRALPDGTAVQLDDHAALVVEGKRATIVATRALKTLATHVEPGAAERGSTIAAANGAVAVVAFANPPTILAVEHRRFAHRWRLPICR